jgi:hypothetical protein
MNRIDRRLTRFSIRLTSFQSHQEFQMDNIAKLQNHIAALEAELDAIWRLQGMQPPIRMDSGGSKVRESRNDAGRRVYDRGA